MSWKDDLAKIAPTVASALGGPFAGAAVKFLSNKLLGTDSGTEADLEQFISTASPETLLSIKNSDNEFKVSMQKLGVDVFEIEANDKKDARLNNKHSIMPAVLSVSLSLVVICIVYMLFWVVIPEGSRDVLFMILGIILKEWGGAMQYWFGTTRGSAEKDIRAKK